MNIQRTPHGRIRLTITNSIVNETNSNTPDAGASSSRNTVFTPCRRVGLSRRKQQNASLNKSPAVTKYDEPSPSSSQQMSPQKHSHNKSSVNDNTPTKNDETANHNENYRLPSRSENCKPSTSKKDESDVSDKETKYSESTSYASQRESPAPKSRKKNKHKQEPPPRKDHNDSVSNNDDDSESNENGEELPELKKRKRDPHNVNNVEHGGSSNNGISSIEIKNILTGIDPELAQIEENNSPANLSQSSVNKISIYVKQKLQQNKWSTSTKVHLSRDDQAVSDNESVVGNSDLSDFSESSNKRKRRTPTNSRSKRFSPKPGPSRPNTEPKYVRPPPSTDSDSDNDFVPTPRSRSRPASMPIKYEPSSQSSVKEENDKSQSLNGDKKSVNKLIKPVMQDELNKTEQIRITKNKCYNVIYKGNILSYVKSHDIDVELKPTESDKKEEKSKESSSDDEQKSMILEQRSYINDTSRKEEEEVAEMDERSAHLDMFDNLDLASISNFSPNTNESVAAIQKRKLSAPKRSRLSLNKSLMQGVTEQSQKANKKQYVPVNKLSTNSATNETNTEKYMDVSKLRKKYIALDNKVKAKQKKVETLQRVSVYKKTHDLNELHTVTQQHKEGAQNSLFDLFLLLNSVSQEPCDMKTLLHNLKIPNELVDYNAEEDKFM